MGNRWGEGVDDYLWTHWGFLAFWLNWPARIPAEDVSGLTSFGGCWRVRVRGRQSKLSHCSPDFPELLVKLDLGETSEHQLKLGQVLIISANLNTVISEVPAHSLPGRRCWFRTGRALFWVTQRRRAAYVQAR